jgi:ribosomal protein S18 acetylase RimI-like enzyme
VVAILKQAEAEFRRMQADDLDAVAAIEASAYEFPWSRAIFADCLRAGYECIVLVDAEEAIGYGVLSSGAGEAHVLNVCVSPDRHGRGHGRRIVRRLLDSRVTRADLVVPVQVAQRWAGKRPDRCTYRRLPRRSFRPEAPVPTAVLTITRPRRR